MFLFVCLFVCLSLYCSNVASNVMASIGWLRCSNDIAKMLKKLRTSKGDNWIKQRFSSIASLFKLRTNLELLLKDKIVPERANCFPLRAVPYGMIDHFYHIG